MKRDFFRSLPSEIMPDIFSRLCVRSIAISKCVCKAWLELLETDDFVNSHLSKSGPALTVMMPKRGSAPVKVLELVDEVDLESRDLLYDRITKFDFPHRARTEGSANGLLLLNNLDAYVTILYVCNPITREFFELPLLPQGCGYGFGASKTSGQHKVVSVNPKSECHVYTLGKGSWRRLGANPPRYPPGSIGAFVNGNLYWLVSSDSNSSRWICCFDVEKECFSSFPVLPPLERWCPLYTWRDCLCLCDTSSEGEVVIWLMKVEKCWSKEYVIKLNPDSPYYPYYRAGDNFEPIYVFKNGDILMLYEARMLLYYDNKTKTIEEMRGMFGHRGKCYCITSMLLTPTFLSLKTLGIENVISM